MKFEGLKLLPGSPLQLQFKHSPDIRERSMLVGYIRKNSVIVSTPTVNGGARAVKVGEQLNVRLFSNECNSAIAFSSQVIHVTVSPTPLLYLDYPSDIATGEVRKAARIATNLISTVKIDGKSLSATIVDLSTTGCRLDSQHPLGELGSKFTLVTKMDAAGSPHIVQLHCEIKALINEDGGQNHYIYGLAFGDLKDEAKLILHAYVYFQLRQ